ncbi:MAG TPA: zinc-binding alcohol dehydrogenase [Hyphomicrobiaceae bacterium]|nr:zinc-binding alcohol dehydrogenase [Hyphomicrobiaceae bacterium]
MMAAANHDRAGIARALWYAGHGVVECRAAPLPEPAAREARVRTLYSGISRGTERLVLHGAVGASEWERMRCPMQEGAFPFPVKYGYCAVGVVEQGPADLAGRTVFCLHPHQDVFHAPADRLALVPAPVPPRRATLAANMETALNALWDSGAGAGDRIVVVGAGIVGLLTASLAARLPGAAVTVVDVAEARHPLAQALGAGFALPATAPGEADVVFHASANGAGLNTALACAGFEATIVEMSWYGDQPITVGLGGAFHSRRLRLIGSQVGHVSSSRRSRWDHRRRLDAALRLLDQPALDLLVAEEIDFEDAAEALPRMLATDAQGLAPVIRYAQY